MEPYNPEPNPYEAIESVVRESIEAEREREDNDRELANDE